MDTLDMNIQHEKVMEKLDGTMLRKIYEQFSSAWAQKLQTQGNVPTFYDHVIKDGLTLFSMNIESIPWEKDLEDIILSVEHFASRQGIEMFISQMVNWYYGRYVLYDLRVQPNEMIQSSLDIDFLKKSARDTTFSMSQGYFDCLQWKDTILFKTVYDLAIYQMLMWELKPKTIIEIGSGTGGSAVWMADLMASYGIESKIISFDIIAPKIRYDNVTFLQGDCNHIDQIMKVAILEKMPKPWLLIEDAHVNVYGVLQHFHPLLQEGDYLIVEDSENKQKEINRFLKDTNKSYLVDAQYCDFFGHNMTCSYDSIFRKMK
ncbi:CmcI family methyltransferase [Kordia zhangzhouensis]|uniref:CmcI family methyltransferase n=1 Tax=Kordia zhangzhouensis TaxID=1620405 RepID=UPI00069B4FA5|nr:CmcI family methyltransferase [Kordia zhangzhouensis]